MLDANAAQLLNSPGSALQRMAASTGNDPQRIDETAEEFEAVMLTAMLKPIFEGVETPEPFGGGEGERGSVSQAQVIAPCDL